MEASNLLQLFHHRLARVLSASKMFTRFVPKKSCKNKNNSGESCRYRFRQFEIARPCRKKRFFWSYALVAIGTSPSQWKMRVDIGKLSRNIALSVGCHLWKNIDGPSLEGLQSYSHVDIKQELSRQHVSSALFGFISRYQPSW